MTNLPKLRKALYALAGAIGALLGVYGIIDGQELTAYLLVVSGLLGVAFYNVDDTEDVDGEHELGREGDL